MKLFKYYKQIFAVIVFLLVILFCVNRIPPGYVGVCINMLGSDARETAKEMHVGFHFTAPWKSVYRFPIFEQNTTWEGEHGFNFQTNEGVAINADVGITYHLKPEAVPLIFQKYRRGMEEITEIFIRNYIRDSLNKTAANFKIEDLYSSEKKDFFEEVEKNVKKSLEPMGVEVSKIYLIGRFKFPENVIQALNAKIEASQRAQQRENELKEAEAQAKKEIAKSEGEAKCALLKAKAESEANITLAKSVTEELIRWQTVQKWDGKLPTVNGGAIPMIDINNLNKLK
jgi:regulator of protease activity HflC (stomatin/prohibitin superfamily)